jgi:murein L,D-transpeptidase YcbB/YkuD
MHAGKKWYTLKNKIPVYIGYFTAWQDTDRILHFMMTFIIEMKR